MSHFVPTLSGCLSSYIVECSYYEQNPKIGQLGYWPVMFIFIRQLDRKLNNSEQSVDR